MYEEINRQLSQARQDLYRAERIETMLESLNQGVYVLNQKVNAAKAVLDKENLDYERMTSVSISSIFYAALGKQEERTEKEHREALEAELKYNQALQNLKEAHEKIAALKAEQNSYYNVRQTYESLYKRKLQMLMEDNSQTAGKIMELNDRMELSRKNMREIGEALSVGGEILSNLDDAMSNLNDAEGWGVWDMVGGGFLSSMAKHSHIDDAGYSVRRAQKLLNDFRAELADVSISANINVEIDGFSKFADFFFDGLISDWFVQNQINDSQASVKNTYRQVSIVMDKLRELKTAEQKAIGGLKSELDNIVTGV